MSKLYVNPIYLLYQLIILCPRKNSRVVSKKEYHLQQQGKLHDIIIIQSIRLHGATCRISSTRTFIKGSDPNGINQAGVDGQSGG